MSLLTPDVCARIVRWARRSDLTALCTVSRGLQHAVEARLYELIVAGSVDAALRASESILAQPRLGPLVRSFAFVPDHSDVPQHVWATLRRALAQMRALEYLCLHGASLGDVEMPFQLVEARLLVRWDAHLVSFLESQNKLKSLHTAHADPALPLEPGSLSVLSAFDGPLSAAERMLDVGPGLSHLQVVLDRNAEANVVLAFIPRLVHLASSLRALSILHLPEVLSIDVFRSITTACPQLRHIGTIPLPFPRNSYRFHGALMAMHNLRVLQLDVTSWSPQPTRIVQRAIAAEIRIYVPLIEYICFWTGATRTFWALDGNDWSSHSDNAYHSHFDALWKAK